MFKIFQICFLLFMFYSSCGWLMEVLNTIRVEKRFVNRGFLIGPYCPIYGCGVLLMSILLKKYIDDIFSTFVFSILICGVLEYITSFVLEKIFNARWWDYSKRKFNINGRVCLENLLIFGMLGLYITYISNPFLLGVLNTVPDIILNIVTIIIFIIFVIDIGISTNIIFQLKDVSNNLRKDNTEEISKRVRKIIRSKLVLQRRLLKAFPNIKSTINLDELIEREKSKKENIKNYKIIK